MGHFLLATASKAVLLCLLSPEGRLQPLHLLLPPQNVPAECVPYAAWRLAPPAAAPASPRGGQQGVSAVVAVAWDRSVAVYRARLADQAGPAAAPAAHQVRAPWGRLTWKQLPPTPLLRLPGRLRPTPSSAKETWRRALPQGRRASAPHAVASPVQSPRSLPPPELLRSWTEPGPSCGAAFLDSGPLVLASTLGQTQALLQLLLPDAYSSPSGGQDPEGHTEQLLIKDWVVGSQVSASLGCVPRSAPAAMCVLRHAARALGALAVSGGTLDPLPGWKAGGGGHPEPMPVPRCLPYVPAVRDSQQYPH